MEGAFSASNLLETGALQICRAKFAPTLPVQSLRPGPCPTAPQPPPQSVPLHVVVYASTETRISSELCASSRLRLD